jgi:hypothetical protein
MRKRTTGADARGDKDRLLAVDPAFKKEHIRAWLLNYHRSGAEVVLL